MSLLIDPSAEDNEILSGAKECFRESTMDEAGAIVFMSFGESYVCIPSKRIFILSI